MQFESFCDNITGNSLDFGVIGMLGKEAFVDDDFSEDGLVIEGESNATSEALLSVDQLIFQHTFVFVTSGLYLYTNNLLISTTFYKSVNLSKQN